MSAHIALAYRTVVFWHRVGTLRHSDTLSAICLSRPPWMNFPATSPDIYHPGNRMRRKDASTAFNGRSDSSTAEWMKVGVHFHLFPAEGWVLGTDYEFAGGRLCQRPVVGNGWNKCDWFSSEGWRFERSDAIGRHQMASI